MKRITLIFTSLLMTVFLHAQDFENLVPNPSFEGKDGRLRRSGQLDKAKGWVSATGEGADLYTKEDDGDIGAPENERGRALPRTGERYAGARFYSYRNDEPRTYMSIELSSKLNKGVTYCVTYYVSLSDLSKYASNNIGAYLSKRDVTTDEEKTLLYEAQILDKKNKIYKDRRLWKPVCAAFTAQGGEKYLTIGNFAPNNDTETEKLRRIRRYKQSQIYDAYYYVDDVSVKPVESIYECQCGEESEEKGPKIVYSKPDVDESDMSPTEKMNNRAIYFDFFTAKLEDNAKEELDKVHTLLVENPEMEVQVIGHSDNKEHGKTQNYSHYKDKSAQRAKAAIKYLSEEKGIDKERLHLKAMQNSTPADEGDDEFARAKNRRVEFKVKE